MGCVKLVKSGEVFTEKNSNRKEGLQCVYIPTTRKIKWANFSREDPSEMWLHMLHSQLTWFWALVTILAKASEVEKVRQLIVYLAPPYGMSEEELGRL